MTTLFVQNKQAWLDKVDAFPNWEVTAKEKLLARHVQEVIDRCGELANDEDFYGEEGQVRYYPQMLVTCTGLNKKTIARIMQRWVKAGLLIRHVKSSIDDKGDWHTSSFIVVTPMFLRGDITIGREQPEKGHVRKGHTFKVCPDCGKRLKKKVVVYECESGHEIVEHKEGASNHVN